MGVRALLRLGHVDERDGDRRVPLVRRVERDAVPRERRRVLELVLQVQRPLATRHAHLQQMVAAVAASATRLRTSSTISPSV